MLLAKILETRLQILKVSFLNSGFGSSASFSINIYVTTQISIPRVHIDRKVTHVAISERKVYVVPTT